jgi:hypothetical protein
LVCDLILEEVKKVHSKYKNIIKCGFLLQDIKSYLLKLKPYPDSAILERCIFKCNKGRSYFGIDV